MRIQLRNRYFCDHCGKSGGHAGRMRSHEEHCTLNPQRVCRHCAASGRESLSVQYLTSCLQSGGLNGLAELRQVSTNCPGCIISAIKQADQHGGIGLQHLDFNYFVENRLFWKNLRHPLGFDRTSSGRQLNNDRILERFVRSGVTPPSWLSAARGLSRLFRGPKLDGSGLIFSFLCMDQTNGFHYRNFVSTSAGMRFESEAIPEDKASLLANWVFSGLTDSDVLEALWAGEAGVSIVEACVSRLTKVLGGQIPARKSARSARNLWYGFIQDMAYAHRRNFLAAAEIFVHRLPEGIAGLSRRCPWPRSLETVNFFCGSDRNAERSQAHSSYPAAGVLLSNDSIRRAIDSSSSLSASLRGKFSLSKSQVKALRSEALALTFKCLFDSGVKIDDLISVVSTLPFPLVPPDENLYTAALRYPRSWRVVSLSLSKYPSGASVSNGRLKIQGYCDDGESSVVGWGLLQTLDDCIGWIVESMEPGDKVHTDGRSISRAEAESKVISALGCLKPKVLLKLDESLHSAIINQRSTVQEGNWHKIKLPRLLQDGFIDEIDYRQLCDFSDYELESTTLSHCVKAYFQTAFEGHYVTFALDGPWRCTLGLNLSIEEVTQNRWRAHATIDQIRGWRNAAVPGTYSAVGRALSEAISSLTFDEPPLCKVDTDEVQELSANWEKSLVDQTREAILEGFPTLYQDLFSHLPRQFILFKS